MIHYCFARYYIYIYNVSLFLFTTDNKANEATIKLKCHDWTEYKREKYKLFLNLNF